MRRFIFAAIFGTLGSLAAVRAGATGQSPIQAILVGILSALGFLFASLMIRHRLRSRQGAAPSLLEGESALLYGPGELSDSAGSAKVWIYVSNLRLMVRDEDGAKVEMPLSDIEELRPPRLGFFGGELGLVAKGRGLLVLKVPDVSRWHRAIHSAIHKE